MKFKILIPVYNDWQSVSKLLENINSNVSNLDHEISVIIMNDASNHDRNKEDTNLENISSVKDIKYENQSRSCKMYSNWIKIYF